jgi:cyclic pyranopterin phosphate synthase
MVDVSGKPVTARTATAIARVQMTLATADSIRQGTGKKGDVLQVARIAAITGCKQTSQLIPLCHPLPIDGIEVQCDWETTERLAIVVVVKTSHKTGVEMEALTGATIAALTVYDMCKSLERGMEILSVKLLAKEGGSRGG